MAAKTTDERLEDLEREVAQLRIETNWLMDNVKSILTALKDGLNQTLAQLFGGHK